MKLNNGKCHLLVPGHHYEEMFINIGNNRIWESKNVELLGITIDKDLKFDKHMNKIFKSFIESQFKYCPSTWMFCSGKSNNEINRLHERSLTIVNNDYDSIYEELLSQNNCFSIHDQNIHRLADEI